MIFIDFKKSSSLVRREPNTPLLYNIVLIAVTFPIWWEIQSALGMTILLLYSVYLFNLYWVELHILLFVMAYELQLECTTSGLGCGGRIWSLELSKYQVALNFVRSIDCVFLSATLTSEFGQSTFEDSFHAGNPPMVVLKLVNYCQTYRNIVRT